MRFGTKKYEQIAFFFPLMQFVGMHDNIYIHHPQTEKMDCGLEGSLMLEQKRGNETFKAEKGIY